jgi:hypothetical protein
MFVLLVSLLLNLSTTFACDFQNEIKSVYSLSGPVTLAFQDLKLLQNKKLLGISIFHPIAKKDFSGKFLPGGLFLSHETIKSFSGSVLFYDESRELSKIIANYKDIKAVEIKNRTMTPPQVVKDLAIQLKTYLSGCDLKEIEKSLDLKLAKLKKMIRKKTHYLFFLGQIRGERLPEMLMVSDGVVKWMKDEKLIQTYPSELPYVNWSPKILNELPRETYRIGLKDSGNSMEIKLERKQNIINLTYPGAFIPGRGQVDAMIYFFADL